jgi:transcriptional regulator with XRE-family HTH domain
MTSPEIRAALDKLDLTQIAVARHLGVNPGTVSDWVRGKRPAPQHFIAWLQAALLIRERDRTIDRLRTLLFDAERKAAE